MKESMKTQKKFKYAIFFSFKNYGFSRDPRIPSVFTSILYYVLFICFIMMLNVVCSSINVADKKYTPSGNASFKHTISLLHRTFVYF